MRLLVAFAAGVAFALSTAAASAEPVIPDTVKVLRLSTGADGESHLDEIALPRAAGVPGVSVNTRLYATDIELGTSLPGTFIDFHRVTTPRFLVILQGEMEIGLGDGSKHVLRKGDLVLAADTTGRGHTSRGVGTEPIIAMTVRLPKDDPLQLKSDPCQPGTPAAQCVSKNLTIHEPGRK